MPHLGFLHRRRKPRSSLRGKLTVPDTPGLDDALLAIGEAYEATELDDLLVGEVNAELGPDTIVRPFGIPDQHARVMQSCLLTRRVGIGAGKVQELGVVSLREPLLSSPERPLRPSVVALDRLGDVHTAKVFQGVFHDAVPEESLPSARKRFGDGGDVRPDGLRLGPRRPEPPSLLHERSKLGIRQAVGVHVADPCHGTSVSRLGRTLDAEHPVALGSDYRPSACEEDARE